ncbi:MAG: glycosyltransferase family 8 protein [Clostridiaceae bacterium]
MYVIYHSSDSFASVTGVSIASLFENNRDVKHIHVLYIERGMKDENKSMLKSLASRYDRTIEFIDMPNWSERLGIKLQSCKSGWLGFGYNRLFITDLLPQDVDKALYLDSDTIIEGSLKELWSFDMDDYYLAGVDDCLSSTYRELVEIDDCGTYCNAGVLLFNVKKWREDNVKQQLIDNVIRNNGYFVFNEQSILNSVFAGKIKILPQEYNINSLVYAFKYQELMRLRKPQNFSYTKKEYYFARENPIITHFTGCFFIAKRPWIEDSDHPHAKNFLKYRNLTPWKGEPLQMDTRDKTKKILTRVCHILPKGIMIILVNILYNYIRPVSFMNKKLKNQNNRLASKSQLVFIKNFIRVYVKSV